MKKRKKYILDKKFQVKTAFSIIGITSIVVTIIIALISINIVNNNNKLSNIIVIQKNVVEALLTYSQENRNREERILINNIYKDHDKNINNIEGIMDLNFKFLVLIIIVSVIQCFILFIFLIRKTHKISGPIYVMSRYIKEIINGKYPETRPLRKGDELKGIYELLLEMIEKLKEKEDK